MKQDKTYFIFIYFSCFLIQWDEEISTQNIKSAQLIVNSDFFDETNPEKQIDYEMYELLYLTIVVTDTEQKFGERTVSGKYIFVNS